MFCTQYWLDSDSRDQQTAVSESTHHRLMQFCLLQVLVTVDLRLLL
jgi:hypothetical protein